MVSLKLTKSLFFVNVISWEVIILPTTLKDAINSIKAFSSITKLKKKTSDELLGKYEGIIPKGKTSTEFLRELRGTLFSKIKG